MPELTDFDLEQLAAALADQEYFEHRYLVDPATGELCFWTSDTGVDGQHPIELDELPHLIGVEPLPSSVWYHDMADFADRLSDDQAGRRLGRALQGRGAFRHFKIELREEYPELLPTWYAFRDNRAHRRAVEWLAEHELIPEDVAEAFVRDHPEPPVP
jgi:hypothetical protein